MGTVEEIQREGCRILEVGNRRIGVISAGDAFYAVHDRCPHKGADMCQGTVGGTFVASAPQEFVYGMHDTVIRCPWHGWEFDLASGRSLLEPDRFGLKTYPVTIQDGIVILHT